MLYVDRNSVPVPEGLINDRSVKENQRAIFEFMALSPMERAQKRPPQTTDTTRVDGLKDSLHLLFNGRCAFCERKTDSLGIHRFRPARNANKKDKNPDARLYYIWFAWVWQNFYLACYECNELLANNYLVTGRHMPVPSLQDYEIYLTINRGIWPVWPPKETPLLLDPCQVKNMATYFKVSSDGYFIPLNRRAYSTIDILDLNRTQLREDREERFKFYLNALARAMEFDIQFELSRLLDFNQLEFGGTWYLLLRQLLSTCTGLKGKRLSLSRIQETFFELLKTKRIDGEKVYWAFHNQRRNPQSLTIKANARANQDHRLKTVRFHNFKSLENIEVTIPVIPERDEGQQPEAQALLILGENAAGKSTCLEGIALALVPQEGREKLKLELEEFIFSPEVFDGESHDRPDMAKVELILEDGESLTLSLDDKGGVQVSTSQQFNVGPVFAYGAFRQYRKGKKEQYSADKSVRNLFDGSLLGNPQAWLLSLSDLHFNEVISALREVLSIEGEFDVIQRSHEKQECYIVTKTGNTHIRTPLNVASSGFRTVLAMVCDILQGLMDKRLSSQFARFEESRGVVLIDEVETHLHPRWKMQIMGGLRRALPGVTFIATTHDPLCLRGMRNGEVIVMRRVAQVHNNHDHKENQKIEVRSDLPDITKMRVDQLLTSDFFQLSSTDEPEMEQQLAQIADLLAKRERKERLDAFELEALNSFERDIASAMPVGTSEAHRIVQEAVALYLQERRKVTAKQVKSLQKTTRDRILAILRGAPQ